MKTLGPINDLVWGPGMLLLLLGTGLYMTLRLRFFTFRNIPTGFAKLWQHRKRDPNLAGELSPFNALMTALAATIGTGNIAGVFIAHQVVPCGNWQ